MPQTACSCCIISFSSELRMSSEKQLKDSHAKLMRCFDKYQDALTSLNMCDMDNRDDFYLCEFFVCRKLHASTRNSITVLLHNWKYAIGKVAVEGNIEQAVCMAQQTPIVIGFTRQFLTERMLAPSEKNRTFAFLSLVCNRCFSASRQWHISFESTRAQRATARNTATASAIRAGDESEYVVNFYLHKTAIRLSAATAREQKREEFGAPRPRSSNAPTPTNSAALQSQRSQFDAPTTSCAQPPPTAAAVVAPSRSNFSARDPPPLRPSTADKTLLHTELPDVEDEEEDEDVNNFDWLMKKK